MDAFAELLPAYVEPAALYDRLQNTACLSESGEMIVATVEGEVAGAVTYVGPGRPKAAFFPSEWPVMRMLVVSPRHRRLGIGRALAEECVRRAERDGAELIALHTTPIMAVALPMYERIGFERHSAAPSIYGVEYGVYIKRLSGSRDAHPLA